jgi:two-component system alkaline phosphatase synthesis response regulator PhoP
MKILVIEDETLVRENIEQILELLGYTAVTANNGSVGLQLTKAQKPDLIICDIMMPELNGYGVLKAIRQNPATESIPVIFLTAKENRTDLRQAMELGADDYIPKPFTPEELQKAIEARLARAKKVAYIKQQYEQERQQTVKLKQQIQINQQKLQESQQLVDMWDEVLQKLSQDLRNPLSSMNMAIHMLKQAQSDTEREKYLNILQKECERETQLLNEIENLKTLLTPENAKLLQKFNLLNQSK